MRIRPLSAVILLFTQYHFGASAITKAELNALEFVATPVASTTNWANRFDFLVFSQDSQNASIVSAELQNKYINLMNEAFSKGFVPSLVLNVPVGSLGFYKSIQGQAFSSAAYRDITITPRMGDFVKNPMSNMLEEFDRALTENPRVGSVRLILNDADVFGHSLNPLSRELVSRLSSQYPLLNVKQARSLCERVFFN